MTAKKPKHLFAKAGPVPELYRQTSGFRLRRIEEEMFQQSEVLVRSVKRGRQLEKNRTEFLFQGGGAPCEFFPFRTHILEAPDMRDEARGFQRKHKIRRCLRIPIRVSRLARQPVERIVNFYCAEAIRIECEPFAGWKIFGKEALPPFAIAPAGSSDKETGHMIGSLGQKFTTKINKSASANAPKGLTKALGGVRRSKKGAIHAFQCAIAVRFASDRSKPEHG